MLSENSICDELSIGSVAGSSHISGTSFKESETLMFLSIDLTASLISFLDIFDSVMVFFSFGSSVITMPEGLTYFYF